MPAKELSAWMGISFIMGNYAGTMAVIEFYAMGATSLIALVKWADWLRESGRA